MDAPTPNFRDQRRDRIILAAREVFFEVGYAGASMSMISARLGGSKATLYAYFNSKEELLAAIIREGCIEMGAIFQAHIGTDDLRSSLATIAREMMGLILSDSGTRLLQLIIEESRRNPDLSKMFNDTIESNGRVALLAMLKTAHDKGQIDVPDVIQAGTVLKSLLFGDMHFKRIMNLVPEPNPDQLTRHIDLAVDVFLTYYSCKDKGEIRL